MKIIDMNLSVGGMDADGVEIDAAYLYRLMDTYRIGEAVCWHQHALLDPADGNRKMVQIAAASQGRLHTCAILDPMLGADNLPGTGNLKERLQQMKPACLRVFPTANRMVWHPFYWEEILDAAQALALPLILDGEYTQDVFCNLPQMSLDYPDIKFIMIRYGACNGRHIMPLLAKCRNVYFTIDRMLDHLQIEEIWEKQGADKLLFGSGYPERPMEGILGLALYADIPANAREQILYKNWEAMHL